MKRTVVKSLATLCALLMAISLAACTASTAPAATEAPASPTAPAETAAATTATPAADLSMQKYDPPIAVSSIKLMGEGVKFVEGDDINNNVWTKLYKDKLGITLTYEWTASTKAQYDDKLNIAIASGDVPDVFNVDNSQLARLVKTDLVNKDLGPLYEQYGTELLKSIITLDGTAALDSATFGGKIAAMPDNGGTFDSAHMMYIRQDWLDGLGKTAPKTVDELMSLVDDFTTKDPDHSGAKDYYGIAMIKDLYGTKSAGGGGMNGIEGFCNAFHAYPKTWIKDASGKLVYGSYQPEMKAALKKLQELYAAGKIDPEFSVKDRSKENELVNSGKIGILFGVFWCPTLLQDCINSNPKADWVAYPIPSVDDKPGCASVKLGVSDYFMCSSDFKYPESLIKMENLFVEMGYGSEQAKTYPIYLNNTIDGTPYEFFHYAAALTWPPMPFEKVPDAVKAKDPSNLNAEEKSYYDAVNAYAGGDKSAWGLARVFGIDGSYSMEGKYKTTGNFMMDGFYGADTNTMIEKKAALYQLELETFIKIIMGDPIDTFDTFVTNAMAMGGSDIEKEVNDWYASTKG